MKFKESFNDWSSKEIDIIIEAYLGAALWSSLYSGPEEDEYENMDEVYAVYQIDKDGMKLATNNVREFLEKAKMLNRNLVDDLGLDISQIGHDLWLSSNGHGAGFFDGQWDSKDGNIQLGDYLQEIARGISGGDLFGIDEDTWSID